MGSAADPKDKLGLAHFTSSMLTRGNSTNRTSSDYHELLESHGANLGFRRAATSIPGSEEKLLLKILKCCCVWQLRACDSPRFPPTYVERLRNQLLAGLAIRDQDTSEVASMLFDQALFPDHPYGNPDDGFIETVQNDQPGRYAGIPQKLFRTLPNGSRRGRRG